jgi:hypothetical protein
MVISNEKIPSGHGIVAKNMGCQADRSLELKSSCSSNNSNIRIAYRV